MTDELKLPYRIHLVPITGPSIETRAWACGNCKMVCITFEQAKECCEPRICKTCGKNLPGRKRDGGWLICDECAIKRNAENRQAYWDKMPEVPYNNEPIYEDSRFYENDEEYWDAHCKENEGEYVELCGTYKLGYNVSAQDVIEYIEERMLDNMEDGFFPETKGTEELKVAIEKFLASQTQEIWVPNGKKAWIEPPKEQTQKEEVAT